MERERITISIKKNVLENVDKIIDGSSIRNRSHAIESLVMKGLGQNDEVEIVALFGGDGALKAIPHAEKVFEKLPALGISKANIATGFMNEKVYEKLGDGSKYNLEFTYNSKGEGSGGALAAFKKELKSTFIVINRNRFDGIDLKNLLSFHRKHGATATIATDDLSDLQGIYIFEPEVFSHIPKGFSMLEEDLLPKLIKAGQAVVCPII